MIDELLLLSGNDLPFPGAQLTIHQPRLKEIAYIGEMSFWSGCELLKFNKESLVSQAKNVLSNKSNFNIIMMMMQEKDVTARSAKTNLFLVLALLFPTSKILLTKQAIQLHNQQTGQVYEINDSNFEQFKDIIVHMFCLVESQNEQYNPSGSLAQKIADKFKQGNAARAQLAPDKKIAIFSRYVSILAIGLQKDINELMNYTVYQLMDEFNRYQLKLRYDSWERWKIAGAEGLEDPQDWLKDIHQ